MARESRHASSIAADIARDRWTLMLLTFVLVAFGLLMIYSSSSIMALTSEASGHNPAYYVERQAAFAAFGVLLAAFAAFWDYHLWCDTLLIPLCLLMTVLLAAVLGTSAGQDAYGATRWLSVFGFKLQPSEFAKATVLLAAANLIERYAMGESGDRTRFYLRVLALVGVPLLLIFCQPDKGTVFITGLTVVIMLFIAGMPLRNVVILAAAGLAIIAYHSLHDAYSRARITILLDPWLDEYGAGYQLIQGYYAFGSGGLLGVGLGMSRQKYSYLPMAHNDFIFAVIGEELGLVGTIGLLLAFFALVWVGYRIARSAPDLEGKLLAAGCVTLLGVQLLVNVFGVLGLMPLSGKPIPFISYGGSSIMSTLILIGLVVSVSRASERASAERSAFVVHEGGPRGLRLIDGGARTTPESLRSSRDFSQEHAAGRISFNANGSRRIDLGPSASDRLRGRDSGRGGRG